MPDSKIEIESSKVLSLSFKESINIISKTSKARWKDPAYKNKVGKKISEKLKLAWARRRGEIE